MKVAARGKILLVGVVAVCTWAATTAILAQTRSSKKRGDARDGVAGPVGRTVEVKVAAAQGGINQMSGVEPPALPRGAIPAPMTSFISLDRMEAATSGRAVTVSMGAGILESLPNVAFIWSVRVYDPPPGRKLLSQHDYNTQIFRTPPGEQVHPTFQDSFPLPPGRYVVQVNLHRISQNFDLSKLADENPNELTRVVSGWKEVVVGD